MTPRPLDPSRVPPPVRDLILRLQGEGNRACLVGGCVRDLIRGTPVLDWDVGTGAVPERVLALFPEAIPTGLKHGTVTVPLPSGPCEVTTFRIESGYSDARRPDRVTFTGDVERDLARRDFTVNAIAWDPIARAEWDPFGGRDDLARRILRAVGDPATRFREDGLRPVRAARFAATLEFEVEPETFAALAVARDQVARVAAERIREELLKMLQAREPSRGFEVLRRAGLLEIVLPELAACVAVPQNRYHAYDVYFHTLYSTDAAPPAKPAVRLAALFHDVGKPATRAEKENGDATFYNHQFESARLTEAAMARLRFSRDLTDRVVHLVKNHMFDYRPEWTDATVRRFVRTVGIENVADLFDLRIADNLGNGLKTGFPHYLGELTERIGRVVEAQEALSVRDLKVDGADVMRELGLPPGPEVGRILDRLLEEVTEDPSLNERKRLLRRLSQGMAIDTAGPPA
ncbi:MAG TPA: HD domain-containing protein [Candidatus Binatia bacterium]|nr:HD domain-containing protein [Candidatus Binatia bacterium]